MAFQSRRHTDPCLTVSQCAQGHHLLMGGLKTSSALEKAMAPHSSTLAWKNPMDGGAWKAAVHGVAEGQTRLSDFTFNFHFPALEKEMATHSSVLA